MNKAGYPQPTVYTTSEFATQPADLERWSEAYKNIWRLVEITGTPLSKAKNIVLRGWKDSEISRFSAWMAYYENKDDIKYHRVDKLGYLDCNLSIIRQAALKMAENRALSDMADKVRMAKTAQTIVDLIYVMNQDRVKVAAEETDRNREKMVKIFNVVKDVNNEVARKKLIRNLARVLSMDTEGLFPEISQALSKLIDAYSYSASRIQDVMNRLGLQISMSAEGDEKATPEEVKENFSVEEPKESEVSTEKVEPPSYTKKENMTITPQSSPPSEEVPIIPRPENRGV